MTILIVGSTGMLGQAIVVEAQRRGFKTVGAARRNAEISVDLVDDDSIASVLRAVNPSMVINAAALTDLDRCTRFPDEAWRVNARAVGVLANLCNRSRTKLIHVSTDHYFVGDGAARHDETAPVSLINEYAASKYAGEELALVAPSNVVIRTNIVGFRGWKGQPTFLEWLTDTLTAGDPISLFDDFYVSSIGTLQFAAAMFDLLDRGGNGLVNLSSRDVFSKKTFIEKFATKFGFPLIEARAGSVSELDIPRAESLGLDVGKAESILGRRLPGLGQVVDNLFDDHARRQCIACPKSS